MITYHNTRKNTIHRIKHLTLGAKMKIRKTRKSSRVVVPPINKNIHPGNDFYQFVNNKWLDRVNMPPSESSFGVSEEIETNIRRQLLDYAKTLMNMDNKSSDLLHFHEKIVRLFFKSGFYSNFHRDHEKTFRKMLSELGCMKTSEDVMRTMGSFIRRNIPTHLSVYLGRDLKNPEKSVLVLTSGSLSLPDTSYYRGIAPGKLVTLKMFETFLKKVGSHFDYEEFSRVATLEVQASDEYDEGDTDEPVMMKGEDLAKKFKSIPWSSFWTAYGLDDDEWPKMNFMVRSMSWINWLNNQLKRTIIADWITWFRVQLCIYFGPLIPSPIDDFYFTFFGERLRGDKVKMSQENLLYHIATYILQPSLSYLYKKCCLSNEHQKDVRLFVSKIRNSAIERVDQNPWMTAITKARTKEKIKEIQLEVVDVDLGPNYKVSLKMLSEIDIVHNILMLGEAITIRDIYYARHPNQRIPPGDAIYEVNAHYYNSGNRLVIPAGITGWPFYDSRQGNRPGWSFGGLGAVVGHELLHAFDEDGKNYDNKGLFRPWWSAEDMKGFNKRTNQLIRLFGNTTFMGHLVNGKATLSENIADLGGLAIALDALKRHLDAAHIHGQARERELRDFFISYAVSWRTKERRQRSVYRLFTDVHAPASLRVNLIVSHFQEFYELFDVKPGNRLYIDPKNRIIIF